MDFLTKHCETGDCDQNINGVLEDSKHGGLGDIAVTYSENIRVIDGFGVL